MHRFLTQSIAIALGTLLASCATSSKPIQESAKTGDYAVTVKVLPAETFTGPHAEMVRDAGAQPVEASSSSEPNRHLVAFVEKNGQPVENADVVIRYRPIGAADTPWTELPVVRMHVAGKGRETTHYGNNVHLAAGTYQVQVSVNGSTPVIVDVTLPPA